MARQQSAALKAAKKASAALEYGRVPRHYHDVLRARVEHPTASLRELGASLGMNKHQYAASLRRALQFAESRTT